MITMPPFKQFRQLAQPLAMFQRTGQEKWYGLWIRPISVRITWLINRFEFLSPNMITVFMIFWGIIASALIVIPGFWGIIAFFLAFQFWTTLDSIDGELARFRKQFSHAGVYLDNIAHVVVHAAVFIALGIKSYLLTQNINFLLYAFIASIIMTLNSAIHYCGKYTLIEKNKAFTKGSYKSNILLWLFRESAGHIEISMIGSAALAAFIIFDNKYLLILYILFFGYSLLTLGGILWSVLTTYRTLTRPE